MLTSHPGYLLQAKQLQRPRTPTPRGPPTTHTTTSSPRAPSPAPHRPLRPHRLRVSPLSPHPPASRTTLRPGKSITKRSVSLQGGGGAPALPGEWFLTCLGACTGQQPQQPGAPPQQDYTKAWEEYYKKQGEWPPCGDRGRGSPHPQPLTLPLSTHSASGHRRGSRSSPRLPARLQCRLGGILQTAGRLLRTDPRSWRPPAAAHAAGTAAGKWELPPSSSSFLLPTPGHRPSCLSG